MNLPKVDYNTINKLNRQLYEVKRKLVDLRLEKKRTLKQTVYTQEYMRKVQTSKIQNVL